MLGAIVAHCAPTFPASISSMTCHALSITASICVRHLNDAFEIVTPNSLIAVSCVTPHQRHALRNFALKHEGRELRLLEVRRLRQVMADAGCVARSVWMALHIFATKCLVTFR